MAPTEFSLRLQKGMTGGFAPSTPTAIHIISRAAYANNLTIQSIADGDFTAQAEAVPRSLSLSESAGAEHEKLLEELHGILKTIPTESPPGSQDIYGKDISIAWGSEDLQWMNRGPPGCDYMESDVQPTEADKKKFERAVEIVNLLVNKSA